MRRILIAIILALVALFITSSVKIVGRDEVALVRSRGTLRQLEPGIHFVKPFSFFKRYELSETHSFSGKKALAVDLGRGERLLCECEITLNYTPRAILDLERRYEGKVWSELLLPLVQRHLRQLSENNFDKITSSDAQAALSSSLSKQIEPLGISLASFTIKDLRKVKSIPPDLVRSGGVKVFVLGLDAFDWLIVKKVGERYKLENLDKIKREGAWGNLRSMEPLISPLIWTTMATGVTPDVHGVTDFLIHDDETGQDIPIRSSMRRVPAIWNMASLLDLSCGVVGWFATFPAEHIKGFVVSDRFAHHMFDPNWKMGDKRSHLPGLTFPDSLYAEIESLYVSPDMIYDELHRFVRGELGNLKSTYDPEDPVSSLRVALSSFETYKNVMDYLYPKYRPDLFAIYFSFTDDTGHLFMRYMDPPMEGVTPAEAKRYGNAIYETYREADHLIGKILNMIGDDGVLMIISDHGFKSGKIRPLSDSRIGFGQAPDWHRINGTIALYGSIIKHGVKLVDASVIDVAPTIMYLLGLPIDKKMMGRVLVDAIDDDYLKQHPIRYSSAYDSLLQRVASTGPVVADETLKAKLSSLGYVSGGSGSLVNLANFYHRSGRFAEALEVWRKLIEKNPDDLGARIGMSNAYFELGNDAAATEGLTEVLKRDPNNLEAIRSLATIYLRRGRARDALALAERGLRVNPHDGQSYFNKGSALQLMGRDSEAIPQYFKAIRYSPDLAEAYANLAQIYLDQGNTQKAMTMAEKALELGADKPEMHYVMGKVLDRSGQRERALARYMAAARLDSEFVLAYIGAGSIMLAQGKVDSAIVLATKAIGIRSKYRPYAYDMRGTAYFMKGDIAGAKQDYRNAIATDSRYIPAHINLAKVYLNEGKRKDAIKELKAVLAIDPGHDEARSLLNSLER